MLSKIPHTGSAALRMAWHACDSVDRLYAVKQGSKMVDGTGNFRVYQNFW